ncbi:MAG: phosphoribosyltransferase [Armatimonadota bacterium]
MLHDIAEYRDRLEVFADRAEAGRVLASMLEAHRDTDAIVLAIPAGGVPVAAEIARELSLEIDLAIVSKITLPWDTEAGYGAVAWDGTFGLNERMQFHYRLSDEVVAKGRAATSDKVRRRVRTLRGDRPFPGLSGRPVILVDDGLASGFTMQVAIAAVRSAGAEEIILAVPTAPAHVAQEMAEVVDELYCANVRSRTPFAVASAYQEWHDVSEEEAKEALAAVQHGQPVRAG